jgi:hypothetical protein
MHQLHCAGLLAQDNHDAPVLAVLCDFGDRTPEQAIGYIVRRRKELTGSDDKRFREYLTMLEVLSESRAPQTQVNKAEKMLAEIDIKRLPSYALGPDAGEAVGETRGAVRGEARGRAAAKQAAVR